MSMYFDDYHFKRYLRLAFADFDNGVMEQIIDNIIYICDALNDQWTVWHLLDEILPQIHYEEIIMFVADEALSIKDIEQKGWAIRTHKTIYEDAMKY